MNAGDLGAVVIIAAFMLIPLAMGAVASRKALPTTEDFFVQGRGMGSVAVFFTVAATWWSAFAFLGSNASPISSSPARSVPAPGAGASTRRPPPTWRAGSGHTPSRPGRWV